MESSIATDATYGLTKAGRELLWELTGDEERLDPGERVALAIALVELERARRPGCPRARR